ncbi:CLUMA_CG021455, isoform A [Clunio marinus]|uniref:CLUMA_CG021455, isoform A n=1 Tax=Clunio marinus TaxID=568069 RepID=A0A1J1JA32_9DIPT|nr:CLUMA_CG021455, isoform A [Clunio marinus]
MTERAADSQLSRNLHPLDLLNFAFNGHLLCWKVSKGKERDLDQERPKQKKEEGKTSATQTRYPDGINSI